MKKNLDYDAHFLGVPQKIVSKELPPSGNNRNAVTHVQIIMVRGGATKYPKRGSIGAYIGFKNYNRDRLYELKEAKKVKVYCNIKPYLKQYIRDLKKNEVIFHNIRYGWHEEIKNSDMNLEESFRFHLCGRVGNYKKYVLKDYSYYELTFMKNYGETYQQTYNLRHYIKSESEGLELGKRLEEMVSGCDNYHFVGVISVNWKVYDTGEERDYNRLVIQEFCKEGMENSCNLLKEGYFTCKDIEVQGNEKAYVVNEKITKGEGSEISVEEEEEMPF